MPSVKPPVHNFTLNCKDSTSAERKSLFADFVYTYVTALPKRHHRRLPDYVIHMLPPPRTVAAPRQQKFSRSHPHVSVISSLPNHVVPPDLHRTTKENITYHFAKTCDFHPIISTISISKSNCLREHTHALPRVNHRSRRRNDPDRTVQTKIESRATAAAAGLLKFMSR